MDEGAEDLGHGGRDASPPRSDGAHLIRPRNARVATLALLARRAAGATVCPSEVAREMAGAAGREDWRGEMPAVHAAVDALVAEGLVRLSWKGEAKAVREGAYRIALPALDEQLADKAS